MSASTAKKKANNFLKVMEHGPTRLIFIGGIVLAIIVAVVALNMMMRPSRPDGQGSAQLESVPTPVAPSRNDPIQPVNTKVYDALMTKSNAQAAAEAKATGGTAMPVPRVGMAPKEEPDPAPLPANAGPATAPATTTADEEAARKRHAAEVNQRYATMAKQFNLLVQRWPQAGGREPLSLRPEPAVTPHPASGLDGSGLATPTPALGRPAPSIRANEAFLAVAMSEANTDDSLPIVRAKILNGPAKGAMLMGTIEATQHAPGGLVRFNLLTPAGGGPSFAIDAIAIDPRTSRSSVASEVDRHTVSRLGALFFSSILEGVSEGLLKGGQQERVITSGQNVVVQREAYTDRDLALIGLGNVGKNGAQMMSSAINRQPTVKLNLNAEIGVLFLKDLVLDSPNQRAIAP